MVLGDLDSYMWKNETQPPNYTIHKNKLKMDKRLKYKFWYHKISEENIGRNISDIPLNNIFTSMSPLGEIKERINKWDSIKIKRFCMAKENISKVKREPTKWENIFANDISVKGLISKIYKELTWLHSKKTSSPI